MIVFWGRNENVVIQSIVSLKVYFKEHQCNHYDLHLNMLFRSVMNKI